MDISDVNPAKSLSDEIQPISAPEKSKPARDIKTSKSFQLNPDNDRRKENVSAKALVELAKELNSYMNDLQTSLGFSIYEGIENQVVVEIKNRETGDLIRQIPPEELLKIREKMIELTGLLFDQTI